MRYQAVMMLFSGAIGLCLSGCSASSPVLRGQSPNAQFASYGSQCNDSGGACHAGGTCQDGQCHSGIHGGGSCPGGACQSGVCPDGHGGKPCLALPFHPVHRNFHTYDVPQGLTYPQQNRPPASYQYPYYTTRGPTDFFMK